MRCLLAGFGPAGCASRGLGLSGRGFFLKSLGDESVKIGRADTIPGLAPQVQPWQSPRAEPPLHGRWGHLKPLRDLVNRQPLIGHGRLLWQIDFPYYSTVRDTIADDRMLTDYRTL